MSSLRERLQTEALLFAPSHEGVLTHVLRRGRRRRIIRGALVAASSLAILLAGLGVWASVGDRASDIRPIEDSLGANTKCGPALEYAKGYGRIDRWVAGETLTRRQWFDHQRKQSGPGGPYTPYNEGDSGLDDVITLCVYDGDFYNFSGSRPFSAPPPKYVRVSIKIVNGTAGFDSIAGPNDRLLPPKAWEEARHGRPLPSPSP